MGTIRDSSGSWVGDTGYGGYGDTNGGYSGDFDGETFSQYGETTGTVGSDGTIYDRWGNDTGYTYSRD